MCQVSEAILSSLFFLEVTTHAVHEHEVAFFPVTFEKGRAAEYDASFKAKTNAKEKQIGSILLCFFEIRVFVFVKSLRLFSAIGPNPVSRRDADTFSLREHVSKRPK